MDNYEAQQPKFSATIDISNDDWGDAEEIELASDEHDLFLQEDYVKTTNNVLPYRVASPTSQPNGHSSRLSKKGSHNHIPTSDDNGSNAFERLIPIDDNDDLRPNSPSPSVVYQTPNYQQFAGSLAPTSPTSIVISFMIIVVILCVTILPIILPQTNTTLDSKDPIIKVIPNNQTTNAITHVEHADARCKCICPPFQLTEPGEKQTNPMQRRLYVGNTTPNQCNCNNIVQPHLNDSKIILKDFCVRCECRYQSRNTTTIKRNVVFFIAVLIGLGLYMIVQYLLKYFRITRRNLPNQFKWLSHQLTDTD